MLSSASEKTACISKHILLQTLLYAMLCTVCLLRPSLLPAIVGLCDVHIHRQHEGDSEDWLGLGTRDNREGSRAGVLR